MPGGFLLACLSNRSLAGLGSLAILLLAACGGGHSAASTGNAYTAFQGPEQVVVQGYAGELMEPFISRDGAYLFFNNQGPNKDLFYATHDPQTDTFTYAGELAVLNTPAVEGVPTLDDHNRFYYVSTFNYPPANASIFDTIYVGDFDPQSPGIVGNLAVVPNLARNTPGELNFDVEVSPDGTTLYFVDGVFSGKPYPDGANFAYAVDSGTGFVRAADSADIFAAINTSDLEYAACISRDGLEFFFTRLSLATLQTTLYRATRPNRNAPFATPQRISAVTGFVEAPALSPDEKTLYYHRRNPETGRFELYRVTRP